MDVCAVSHKFGGLSHILSNSPSIYLKWEIADRESSEIHRQRRLMSNYFLHELKSLSKRLTRGVPFILKRCHCLKDPVSSEHGYFLLPFIPYTSRAG